VNVKFNFLSLYFAAASEIASRMDQNMDFKSSAIKEVEEVN
jgi:hypothetical protein